METGIPLQDQKQDGKHRLGIRRWTGIVLEAAALLVAIVYATLVIPGKPAPSVPANRKTFTLTGLDGKPISPREYQGKALLLNFWAPWCAPCRIEIPWLQNLQDRSSGKLIVVGVVADESDYGLAAAFMKQRGVTYPLAEESPSIEKAFGDPSMLPSSFYVSPSGYVVHSVTGLIPRSMMNLYAGDAMSRK